MKWLVRKVKIFEIKGRKEDWKKVRAALKEAGIKGVRSDIWQDELPVCGCGGKIDVRDYGEKGRIDRDIYSIRVAETEVEAASEIVRKVLPDYQPYSN